MDDRGMNVNMNMEHRQKPIYSAFHPNQARHPHLDHGHPKPHYGMSNKAH